MDTLVRSLRWPIISLLITGGLHFTAEALWPDLRAAFVPSTLAPLLLAYGAWAGYATIAGRGTWFQAIAGVAILGLLPFALDVVGFGLVLGRGLDAGTLSGVFGWLMIVFGGLVGSGVALSRAVEPATAPQSLRVEPATASTAGQPA